MKWLLIFFVVPLYGYLSPWYPSLFEIETDLFGTYRKEDLYATSDGDLLREVGTLSLDYHASMTLFPYWNVYGVLKTTHVYEGSVLNVLLFAKDRKIDFSYENILFGVRHLFFDEMASDPLNISVGGELFFPQGRFLHHLSFPYHSYTNAQLFVSLGKTLIPALETRMWVRSAIGIANRGKGWLALNGALESSFILYTLKAFASLDYGFGQYDVSLNDTFKGYGLVAYRIGRVGAEISKHLNCRATLSLIGDYTLYSQNFAVKDYTFSVRFHMPFGL